jgi:hypothetical protein
MIAKNYIKYPEALRFQCEMFSNGYHNSPRIMRLMEVIFDWSATVPDWVKEAKTRARNLVKAWKSRMVEMFEMLKTKAKKIDPRQLELMLFPEPEAKEYWKDNAQPIQIFIATQPKGFTPTLHTDKGKRDFMRASGAYRLFCRNHENSARFKGSFEYQAWE